MNKRKAASTSADSPGSAKKARTDVEFEEQIESQNVGKPSNEVGAEVQRTQESGKQPEESGPSHSANVEGIGIGPTAGGSLQFHATPTTNSSETHSAEKIQNLESGNIQQQDAPGGSSNQPERTKTLPGAPTVGVKTVNTTKNGGTLDWANVPDDMFPRSAEEWVRQTTRFIQAGLKHRGFPTTSKNKSDLIKRIVKHDRENPPPNSGGTVTHEAGGLLEPPNKVSPHEQTASQVNQAQTTGEDINQAQPKSQSITHKVLTKAELKRLTIKRLRELMTQRDLPFRPGWNKTRLTDEVHTYDQNENERQQQRDRLQSEVEAASNTQGNAGPSGVRNKTIPERPKTVSGDNGAKATHEAQPRAVKEANRPVAKQAQPEERQKYWTDKNGVKRWIEWQPTPVSSTIRMLPPEDYDSDTVPDSEDDMYLNYAERKAWLQNRQKLRERKKKKLARKVVGRREQV